MTRKAAALAEPKPATATDAAQPLAFCYLSPLNPRQVVDDGEIDALAGSIATVGLLQPLIGHQDLDCRVGITGGGRRLRALQLLADEGWTRCAPIVFIPVRLAPDEASAIAWAGAQQEARRALHPADEITAYAAMQAQGANPATIARTFAVTEAHVARRLALAGLPEPVIANLRAGRISLDIARALTLAGSERRAIEVLDQVLQHAWRVYDVRTALTQNTVNISDRRARFVGVEAYEAAGGPTLRDLFEDRCYLSDAALLDRLFNEKGLKLAEDLALAEGWSWALFATGDAWQKPEGDLQQIYPDTAELPDGDAARLEELAEIDGLGEAEAAEMAALEARATAWTDEQRATGGIIVSVDYKGAPQINAYRRKASGGDTGGGAAEGSDTGKVKAEKPLPENLLIDLNRIKRLAVQTALMDKIPLMLDLLDWQLSSGAYYDTPLGLSLTPPLIAPDKPDGTTISQDLALPERDYKASFSRDSFAAYLETPPAARMARLGRSLARLYTLPGGDLNDALAAELRVNPRDVWTPTAAGYFARLPGPALDRIYCDLTPVDRADHKAFKALKKAGKAAALADLFGDQKHSWRAAMRLTPDEEARLDTWLPPELCFTPVVEFGAEEPEGDGDLDPDDEDEDDEENAA